jgi:hypothetical protein
MVFLLPHYVINSSLSMSEAPMLACALTALLLAVRSDRGFVGGIVGGMILGCAALIRPMAVFAALGYIVYRLSRRQPRQAVAFTLACAVVIAAGLFGLHLAFGDALHGMRAYASEPGAYNGNVFTWPFGSLILTPLHHPAERAKIPYIAVHVLLVLFGCVTLWRRPGELSKLAATWLTANTAFVLCIGSNWGFEHFPRFTIPAQACLFLAYRHWLPSKMPAWSAAAALMMLQAVWGVANSP